MAEVAEWSTAVRELLVKQVAWHCLRAEVLQCVANYYDLERAAFWDRRISGLSWRKRLGV
jgi:hypothetical protein